MSRTDRRERHIELIAIMDMSNIELNDGNIQPSRNFPAISYIAEADSDWVAKPSESIHPMPVCAVCGQNVPADLLKDQESNAGNESLQ